MHFKAPITQNFNIAVVIIIRIACPMVKGDMNNKPCRRLLDWKPETKNWKPSVRWMLEISECRGYLYAVSALLFTLYALRFMLYTLRYTLILLSTLCGFGRSTHVLTNISCLKYLQCSFYFNWKLETICSLNAESVRCKCFTLHALR